MFEIFLRVTTLLKVINSLGVTTINIFFTGGLVIFSYLNAGYLNSLTSISVLVNALNMSTCFEGFLGFLRPSLSNSKGTKGTNRVIYIKVANIGSTCIRDTYARSISPKNTFFARGVYVKGTFVRGICI